MPAWFQRFKTLQVIVVSFVTVLLVVSSTTIILYYHQSSTQLIQTNKDGTGDLIATNQQGTSELIRTNVESNNAIVESAQSSQEQSTLDLFEQISDHISENVIHQTLTYLKPAQVATELVADQVQYRPKIMARDSKALMQFMASILRVHPQLASTYIGDHTGMFFELRREQTVDPESGKEVEVYVRRRVDQFPVFPPELVQFQINEVMSTALGPKHRITTVVESLENVKAMKSVERQRDNMTQVTPISGQLVGFEVSAGKAKAYESKSTEIQVLWLQNKHKVGFTSRSKKGFTLDEWMDKLQVPITEIISLVEGAGAKNIVENVKEVVTKDGRTISDHVRNIDFDPRDRPWYQTASQTTEFTWTDVYLFHRQQMPGLSAVRPIFDEHGRFVAATSSDITLQSFSEFLQSQTLGPNSEVFIMNGEGQILAYPDSTIFQPKVGTTQVELPSMADMSPLHQAVWEDHQRKNSGQIATEATYSRVEVEGQAYLATMVPFPEDFAKQWQVVLLIPEAHMLGEVWAIEASMRQGISDITLAMQTKASAVEEDVAQQAFTIEENIARQANSVQQNSLLISLLIVAIAMLIVSIFARRLSGPINRLSEQVDSVRNFHLDNDFSTQSGIWEVQNMARALHSMQAGLQSFSRYVPSNLVRQLVDSGEVARLGGERKQLAILFSDVANFTTMAEQVDAEFLMQHLSEYLEVISQILTDEGGTIDKYIGDAVMAFWGAPNEDARPTERACISALRCSRAIAEMNRAWIEDGKPPLPTRFGVHVGSTVVGNIGSSDRMNYTIIGDSVNFASRLEAVNKRYGTWILVSEDVVEEVGDLFWTRPIDIVAVKGKAQGIKIHELVATRSGEMAATEAEQQHCIRTEQAFELYLSQKWNEALVILNELAEQDPDDTVISILSERCHTFLTVPPPTDWNGVMILKEK